MTAKISSVLIHYFFGVNSETKKCFDEKIVLINCATRLRFVFHSQTEKLFGRFFFSWTACDANDIVNWCCYRLKPPHHLNKAFCAKENLPVLETTYCSCWAAKTHFTQNFMFSEKQSLDHMLVYAKDFYSSADYWILNSFETYLHSPGLNHSKCSITNDGHLPTMATLFVPADSPYSYSHFNHSTMVISPQV